MTFFSAFALSFGMFLALTAAISAWLFRTSNAPLASKVLISLILMWTACATPYAVSPMMGFPVQVNLADLPERAELKSFLAHDEAKTVDLWLITGTLREPRAYETALTEGMKKTLGEAEGQLQRGERVMLTRRGKSHSDARQGEGTNGDSPPGAGKRDTDASSPEYELDHSAFALPSKTGGED